MQKRRASRKCFRASAECRQPSVASPHGRVPAETHAPCACQQRHPKKTIIKGPLGRHKMARPNLPFFSSPPQSSLHLCPLFLFVSTAPWPRSPLPQPNAVRFLRTRALDARLFSTDQHSSQPVAPLSVSAFILSFSDVGSVLEPSRFLFSRSARYLYFV